MGYVNTEENIAQEEKHTTGMTVGVRATGADAETAAAPGELVPAGMYRAPPVKGSPRLVPVLEWEGAGGAADELA